MLEKSHFGVLLLCSFALIIDTGYALRCYGCSSIPRSKEDTAKYLAEADFTIAKDYTNCEDGYGKEFDCPGTCMKSFIEEKSLFFKAK